MNEDYEELKKAINNLIWMHAPSELTLIKAEDIAIDILIMITEGKDAVELKASREETGDE